MISSSPIRKRTTTRTEDENIDDELDDEDEIISAGGAIEEEEDDVSEAGDGVADGHVHEARGLDGIVRAAEPAPPTDGRARRIRQPPADALPAAAVAHPRSVDVAVRVAAGPGPDRIALRGTRDGRGDARDPGAAAVGQGDDGDRPGLLHAQAGADGRRHVACFGWFVAGFGIRRPRRRQERARADGGRREAGRRAAPRRPWLSNPCRTDSPP